MAGFQYGKPRPVFYGAQLDLSTAYTLPSTLTRIPFDTVTYDVPYLGGSWVNSDTFVIPAGVQFVSVSCNIYVLAPGSNAAITLVAQKNGVEIAVDRQLQNTAQQGGYVAIALSCDVAEGDVIDVLASSTVGAGDVVPNRGGFFINMLG